MAKSSKGASRKEIKDYYDEHGWRQTISHFRLSPKEASAIVKGKKGKKKAAKKEKAGKKAGKKKGRKPGRPKGSGKKKAAKKAGKKKAVDKKRGPGRPKGSKNKTAKKKAAKKAADKKRGPGRPRKTQVVDTSEVKINGEVNVHKFIDQQQELIAMLTRENAKLRAELSS